MKSGRGLNHTRALQEAVILVRRITMESITDIMVQRAREYKESKHAVCLIEPVVSDYSNRALITVDATDDETGERITNFREAYKMSDEKFKVYVKLIREYRERLAYDFLEVENEMQCPLLVAENNVVKQRWHLLRAVRPLHGMDDKELQKINLPSLIRTTDLFADMVVFVKEAKEQTLRLSKEIRELCD